MRFPPCSDPNRFIGADLRTVNRSVPERPAVQSFATVSDMAEQVEDSTVQVVPHDRGWPNQFLVEAAVLHSELGDLVTDLEHIGSTAVPGLWAKPIIDIMVGTHSPNPPSRELIDDLHGLGYRYQGEDGRRPGRFIFHRRQGAWYNLSIVPHGSYLWDDNINVRDYLATHPEAATAYSAIKRQVAALNVGSPQGYQDGKRAFVDALRRTARIWAVNTRGHDRLTEAPNEICDGPGSIEGFS